MRILKDIGKILGSFLLVLFLIAIVIMCYDTSKGAAKCQNLCPDKVRDSIISRNITKTPRIRETICICINEKTETGFELKKAE
jgi:hypothetical protein